MKIISDTLAPVIETWDDPGDYPSGAGAGPLASFQFVADVEGEIVLKMESSDFIDGGTEVETDLPHGIIVKRWNVTHTPTGILLTVAEFESGRVEAPERDYEYE